MGRIAATGGESEEDDVQSGVERFHRIRLGAYASGPNGGFKSELDRKIDTELDSPNN
ncbi:hypothetical protein ABZ707_04145 [Streptomyces sp. NPDC006923]|uniref:hypothetical protein n=1 Tax=Streptomyces sp. NPDC006923 TaxID=3155355 RepID=UPI0033EF5669